MRRFLSFLGRRFSPGGYLGLHLTLGVILCLAGLGLFLVVTHDANGEKGTRLLRLDNALAEEMEAHANEHPALRAVMCVATDLGGIPAMITLTLLGSLFALYRRQRLVAVVWVVAAAAGGAFTLISKDVFDRERPPNPDAHVHEHNFSYPSGHSMGSVIGYGMLGYGLLFWLRRRWQRVAAIAGLTVLVLLIGLSRIYLRAHYFSDVLGGYLIGLTWLAVCVTGLETVRRRAGAKLRRQEFPDPEPAAASSR